MHLKKCPFSYEKFDVALCRQDQLISTLKTFKPTNDKVKEFRFLLYGPIGAGKSAIVNTLKSILEGRMYVICPTASEVTKSYTSKYEKYQIGNAQDGLSLTFSDTMGVELGEGNGVHIDDIISALKGHILEGYTFNCRSPLTEDNKYYRNNPSLQDRIHCLVIVIAADKLAMIKDGDSIKQMKIVRERTSTMGILQVVLMTRVDLACPLTKKDLHNVYKSSKIKRKIRECSVTLGVPETCIFPVCNYHQDTDMREDINCLMLDALTKIVPWADDYIVRHSNN
ncbi:hypothetical protein NFI96_014055 [Prochilodus magdalenae]|nr:hypothetical protein NFI96_014055 [Prochilodus magdalenae]